MDEGCPDDINSSSTDNRVASECTRTAYEVMLWLKRQKENKTEGYRSIYRVLRYKGVHYIGF